MMRREISLKFSVAGLVFAVGFLGANVLAWGDHTYNRVYLKEGRQPPRSTHALEEGAPRKLVFLSSRKFTGREIGGPDEQGAAHGDALCQRMATEAGLPGEYKAWLSDARTSPAMRFTRATAPYALLDGTIVADGWADLTDGTLDHHIQLDEYGRRPDFQDIIYVWTGTFEDGRRSGGHCNAWKSRPCRDCLGLVGHGELNNVGENRWSRFVNVPCVYRNRLYCFQQ